MTRLLTTANNKATMPVSGSLDFSSFCSAIEAIRLPENCVSGAFASRLAPGIFFTSKNSDRLALGNKTVNGENEEMVVTR